MRKYLMVGLGLLALAAGGAQAQEVNPAVVFDMGGKFDKSFNEGVYNGVERFRQETGIKYREFEVTNETQREQALRKMAQRGSNPVLGVGFAQAPAMEKVAKEFPDTRFTIIDMVVDQPNVQSVVFKEHEGSFLVGVLAAAASKTNKVGFVGGMDIPLIRRFACGYVQGVKHANPNAEVFQNMTGSTPAAWNNPPKGSELAKSQFDRGADVVYAAAGGTGIGVYQAAKDAGKFAIGVDALQHRGQHGARMQVVLVAVDADRQIAGIGRRLIDAGTGSAGRGIDHIGATIELAARQLAAAARVVPGGRRRAGHVLVHLHIRVGIVHALLIAAGELADQRDVHAADKTDLSGLRGHGCQDAHQERALMLLEDDRLNVRQIDHTVDQRELGVGELPGDHLDRRGLGEANGEHDIGAAAGHAPQRLLALGLVGDLELGVFDAGLLAEPLNAAIDSFVERPVELAAHVEHDCWRNVLGLGRAGCDRGRHRD